MLYKKYSFPFACTPVISILLWLLVFSFSCSNKKESAIIHLTMHVNPFIGTGFHGHVFLGANVPFGGVQLGPVNLTEGWDWCSGYHYSDSTIIGFSHTHLNGTGIGDLGDICHAGYGQRKNNKRSGWRLYKRIFFPFFLMKTKLQNRAIIRLSLTVTK